MAKKVLNTGKERSSHQSEVLTVGSANEGIPPLTLSSPEMETAGIFPIAAIGASAGGLEALEDFFSNMPPEPGISFVVIQHLSPGSKSVMRELLQAKTKMAVHRALALK